MLAAIEMFRVKNAAGASPGRVDLLLGGFAGGCADVCQSTSADRTIRCSMSVLQGTGLQPAARVPLPPAVPVLLLPVSCASTPEESLVVERSDIVDYIRLQGSSGTGLLTEFALRDQPAGSRMFGGGGFDSAFGMDQGKAMVSAQGHRGPGVGQTPWPPLAAYCCLVPFSVQQPSCCSHVSTPSHPGSAGGKFQGVFVAAGEPGSDGEAAAQGGQAGDPAAGEDARARVPGKGEPWGGTLCPHTSCGPHGRGAAQGNGLRANFTAGHVQSCVRHA